ncbi:MAG TPA: class I SAM-dependent methyltransferase [Candidatus Saccharimonadales bacterium]|nr:class I SAM-dependent methyltransferase [Candidatus Saccharimonadales bacterium]
MPDKYTWEAVYYDAIYTQMKDYAAEAERVVELIDAHTRVDGGHDNHNYESKLLDVACGTGLHAQHLASRYRITGIDLSPAMLQVAQDRLPEARWQVADMKDFNIGANCFEAVTCLFSAVGHLGDADQLNAAVACMARQLRTGGVLVIEPWIPPEEWDDNRTLSANFVPEEAVARITQSRRRGNRAELDMHFFVDWHNRPRYFVTHHELTLFTSDQYMAAFAQAGLDVHHHPYGLMGRGLFIGVKNS